MLRTASRLTRVLAPKRPSPTTLRSFSASAPAFESILPVSIKGRGTGTAQTVSVKDKTYTFQTDTYPVLGGHDSAPSPVVYSLASLGSCNQVTGAVVARDHGIQVGQWEVTVDGDLPTAVLASGEQGNPNWVGVALRIEVQTDVEGGNESPRFRHFVEEVERRCPITQLFKRSGVAYTSQWVNLPL